VYEITLDASCEDLITEDIDAFPAFVVAHDFRQDVKVLAKITDPAERKAFIRALDLDRANA